MTTAPTYFSQWGDLSSNHAVIERREDPAAFHDWRSDGYSSVEEYRRWSANTCGIACLESVLSTRGAPVPRKADLVQGAVAAGALVPRDDGRVDGLFYQPFVEWVARDFEIEAETRRTLDVGEVRALAASGDWFVMASVSSEIRWPDRPATRRGGHLVLVHDVHGDDLVFHNPSGLAGTAGNARCTPETFARFFAGRGITMRRTR